MCHGPRALISRWGNWLLSLSLSGSNLKTLTCVVRSYRREVIDSLELFSDDKDIHLEIIDKARMLGFRIVEVPAELRWKPGKRTTGKKGMSAQSFFGMASRHLFLNFLFRPSLLSVLPMVFLGLIVFCFEYCLGQWLHLFSVPDGCCNGLDEVLLCSPHTYSGSCHILFRVGPLPVAPVPVRFARFCCQAEQLSLSGTLLHPVKDQQILEGDRREKIMCGICGLSEHRQPEITLQKNAHAAQASGAGPYGVLDG